MLWNGEMLEGYKILKTDSRHGVVAEERLEWWENEFATLQAYSEVNGSLQAITVLCSKTTVCLLWNKVLTDITNITL